MTLTCKWVTVADTEEAMVAECSVDTVDSAEDTVVDMAVAIIDRSQGSQVQREKK